MAEEVDPAPARDEAADRVHECRLARAVGADESDHRAVVELDAHVVDCGDAAEAHREVFDAQRGHRVAVGLARVVERHHCRPTDGRAHRTHVRAARASRTAAGGERKELIAHQVHDADQTAREVHEQEQQTDAAGEQRDVGIVTERGGRPMTHSAPRTGPITEPSPPITAMVTTLIDVSTGNDVTPNWTNSPAKSPPASPQMAPEIANAVSFARAGTTVNAAAERSLSRVAITERPMPLLRSLVTTAIAITNAARHR